MCDPVTAMTAMQIGGSVMSYQAQRSSARQARQHAVQLQEHQLDQYIDNAERADVDAKRNYKEINQRIGQEGVKAALEINEIFRTARQLQTSEISSAAERGVDGPLVDVLLDNIKFNELRAVQNIRQEQVWRLDQYGSMKEQIEAQGNARVESMNPQPIPLSVLQAGVSPNPLAAFTNMGSQILGMWNQMNYDPWRTTPSTTPTFDPSNQYTNPNTGNSGSNTQSGTGDWT